MLSPATLLRSPSESDFLLLALDRLDDLRVSFGAAVMRSFNVNFWPPSECPNDGRLDGGADFSEGVFSEVGLLLEPLVEGTVSFSLALPAEKLGARLGAWLGGRVEGALQHSLSEGEGESKTDGAADPGGALPDIAKEGRTSLA